MAPFSFLKGDTIMFLSNYMEVNPNIKKFSATTSTFSAGYQFWLNYCFERAIRRFVYKGLPDTIPQHEIEVPLQLQGTVGITDKYKKELRAFNGMWAGEPTIYYDIYNRYSVYSPLYSKILTDNKEIVVGLNDSLQNATYNLCHRYAVLLAHLETSLIDVLIEGRDTGGIPVVSTEQQRQAVIAYRDGLCNGLVKPIFDSNTFNPIEWKGITKNASFTVSELIESRENLLNSFYQDIGVRTVWNKKGNMIADEVGGNSPMLLQNVGDMLNQRKLMCDKVNLLYGTNWTVDLSPELKYDEEKKEDSNNGNGENYFKENIN